MPSISVRLGKSQTDDLVAMCGVGASILNRVAEALAQTPATIKRSNLKETISNLIADHDAAEATARALPGLATAIRRYNLSATDLMEGVELGMISQNLGEGTLRLWHECRPIIENILQTDAISLFAKARDLAFDFERLYARARILTDIRPVYDDDRNVIIGADITQTLRLDYFIEGGTKTLTIALDNPDVEQLQKCCEDALRKAEVARKLIEDSGLQVVLPGERLQ